MRLKNLDDVVLSNKHYENESIVNSIRKNKLVI